MGNSNSIGKDKEESKLVSIPTSKDHLVRFMNEDYFVANIAKDIELETARPGEFELQLDERRYLMVEGLKKNVEWALGAKVGLGVFASCQAMNTITKSTRTPRMVAFDAALSAIVAARIAFHMGAQSESATELPLRPGYPSKTVDEYCPIIVRHTVKAVMTYEGIQKLGSSIQSSNQQIFWRAYQTCINRSIYEHKLRREQGLSKDEPVFIPEPGVPEDAVEKYGDEYKQIIRELMDDPKFLRILAKHQTTDQVDQAKIEAHKTSD